MIRGGRDCGSFYIPPEGGLSGEVLWGTCCRGYKGSGRSLLLGRPFNAPGVVIVPTCDHRAIWVVFVAVQARQAPENETRISQ